MKKHERMSKAELIRCIEASEQRAPAASIAFERERLLHELQVQQVALERQNRELREAQQLVELSRDRYAGLYDFAPVGYLTLDDKGIIRDINLTAAGMLGVERNRLVGGLFHVHVEKEDLAQFRGHLQKLSGDRMTTELRLNRKGGAPLPVVMQSVLVYDSEKKGFLCRAALTDITARLQAEQALRDNEARLRAILDTAVNGIITIDERGMIESYNQAAEMMFGYAANEAIGKNVSMLMPSPHRKQHDDYLSHYLETNERKVIGLGREVSGRRKDGSVFPMDLSVGEVQLAGRRIFTGIVRDITRRKQAEEALHVSEERLAYALDATTDGLWDWNIKTGEVYFSPQWIRLLGYSPEEVPPTVEFWKSIVHPDDMTRVMEAVQAHFEGRTPIYYCENRLRMKSGQYRWNLDHGKVVAWDKNGAPSRMVGTDADITDRKRGEEALRESEQRYRGLVEASPDAIFVLKHGRIEFINLEGVRLLGAKSAQQVLGKSPFDFFRKSRHEIIRERIGRLSRSSSASPLVEEELVRLDGSTRWVTLNTAMFTEVGESAVQFIMHDVTERRRLEAELLDATDREQQRIGHDLHDGLGQQLTALEMRSFLLLEALAADNLPGQRKKLEEQARQISQALRECITTTRSITHGLAPVVLKSGGLTGALEQLARQTQVPGRIECRLDCRKPVIVDDAQIAKHLFRIAQEAVNNALKHARPRSIGINLTRNRDTLRLQISDDGRGLPKSRKSKTGLGLEVMHHRAHVIGAFLDIDSKPGRGVTVTCTLPLRKT